MPGTARAAGASKTLHHRQTPRFKRTARALSQRVSELRRAREWSIERAAEEIGVEPAHVRRIEAGDANPSLAVLVSLAHAFGLTVSELLAPRAR